MKRRLSLRKFWLDQTGVTAIEYGLIAALIVVVIIVAVRSVSSEMITMYDYISSTVDEAISNH